MYANVGAVNCAEQKNGCDGDDGGHDHDYDDDDDDDDNR